METTNSSQKASVRKVSCPKCGTVYAVPEDSLTRPSIKATCKKCGTSFFIGDPPGKEQPTSGNGANARESSTSQQGPPKYKYTPILQREIPGKGHDPVAVVIIILCIAAMLFFGFMAYKSFAKRDYFKSLRQLLDNVARKSFFIPQRKRTSPDIYRNLKGDKYSDLLRAGHKYFRKRQYDGAIKLYSAVLARKPDNIEALYWRGRALENKGDNKGAIKDYEKVITRDPKYTYAYDHIAWIYINSKTWNKAIAYLTKSIQIAPENGWAYYNRGRCYYKLGEQQKALADVKKACELGYKLGCQVYERYKK